MTWIEWYNALEKPVWTPSSGTISLIWTLLYPVIFVTFGIVFWQTLRKKWPWPVAIPFAINLVANLLFMPFFSGLRNLPLATADIIVVWCSLIVCIVTIWPYSRWVALAQLPYLTWVSIAMTLQTCIFLWN